MKMIALISLFVLSACNQSMMQTDLLKADSQNAITYGQIVDADTADARRVVLLCSDENVCTGTALADDVLLVAAHCLTADRSESWAGFGTELTCENGYDRSHRSTTTGVREFVGHPGYSSDQNTNDVALVFLENRIPAGYPIYKIAKPSDVTDSSTLGLLGYGETLFGRGDFGLLRRFQVPRAHFQVNEDQKEIIIDQSGGGVCRGDSGGPGLINVNGELQILGINSYIFGGKLPDRCRKQSAMTLVNSHRAWIETQMAARGRHLLK